MVGHGLVLLLLFFYISLIITEVADHGKYSQVAYQYDQVQSETKSNHRKVEDASFKVPAGLNIPANLTLV